MSKKIILIGLFLFLILYIIVFMYKDKQNKVCFKDTCFQVELAQTEEQRKQGLMFREELDQDKGMLFIFEEQGLYSFWMKNVKIPLDLIWINEDKEVVYIKENALLEEKGLKTDKPAKYVLEVNAGVIEKIDLRIGDKLDIILE